MKSDYRNSPYCPVLSDVSSRKLELGDKIHADHPKLKITYNRVKDKGDKYKIPFVSIFNYKCCYCGNSVDNINMDLFEIDHYICESSFSSKEEAGKISNLVCSCYDCNRAKKNLIIPPDYADKLHPELEDISKIFLRDDRYYIIVAEEYKDDSFIQEFYKTLKFEYQSRRIDYLLLSLRGLCKKNENTPYYDKLNSLLVKLQQKRNLTGCKII